MVTMLIHNTTIVRDGKTYAHGDEIQVSYDEQCRWAGCLRLATGSLKAAAVNVDEDVSGPVMNMAFTERDKETEHG